MREVSEAVLVFYEGTTKRHVKLGKRSSASCDTLSCSNHYYMSATLNLCTLELRISHPLNLNSNSLNISSNVIVDPTG
jgi:hypothetical protein